LLEARGLDGWVQGLLESLFEVTNIGLRVKRTTERGLFELVLGSSAGSFGEIIFERAAGTAVSSLSAPSFTTDNYSAGSPRFYITLSDGKSLWGYPSNAGLAPTWHPR
jgi:hypothetical protein